MATTNISTEIVSITGVTAHAASDDFIVSAQKFVVASVPKELLKWAASLTTASSHGGNTSQGVNIVMPTATDSILDVSRNGFSATEVPYSMKGFIANSSSLQLATNTYPKYYLDNAVTDKGTIVIVKPVPTDSETARVLYVDYTKIDDDCDLRDAVVYRACSSEFSKLATAELPTVSIAAVPPDVPTISASTISFSTTAPSYSSPTTTISGTGWSTAYPDEYSAINTALAAITTEVGLAKTEVAEIVTQTDNSSNFETACDAMATELNKVDNIIVEASTEIDKSSALLVLGEADSEAQVNTAIVLLLAAVAEAEIASGKFVPATSDSQFDTNATWDATNSQLTRVKDALDKVSALIESDKPASSYDAHDLLQTEDLELLQGNLSIVQAEIQRAQMHLQEWVSVGDMRAKHVNSALAEADGQAKVIQTHLQQAQTKREESQARLAAGGAYLQEAQSYIAQANGYAAEVNARGGFTGAKYRAVQGYLETANGYANEVQSLLGQTPMKVSEYQAKLQDALNEFNDDNAEYQAQLQISIQNAQMEDAEESKKLQKYSAELQQYASEVQSEVSEYQSKLQKQQVIEKEADKYYQWSVNCVTMYVQNNSKMIASTMASRGAQA
jgi:hypothetical protein